MHAARSSHLDVLQWLVQSSSSVACNIYVDLRPQLACGIWGSVMPQIASHVLTFALLRGCPASLRCQQMRTWLDVDLAQ